MTPKMSVATNKIINANPIRNAGFSILAGIKFDKFDAKVVEIQIAIIQVAKEIASFIKPRNKLNNVEMIITAKNA